MTGEMFIELMNVLTEIDKKLLTIIQLQTPVDLEFLPVLETTGKKGIRRTRNANTDA